MGHTLSESMFIPTMNRGIALNRDRGNITIGNLETNEEQNVHSLQVVSKRSSSIHSISDSEPFAFDIQALSLTYQNLEAVKATLEQQKEDMMWVYAANSFDYENEQSVIGVIRVMITVMLEDEKRNFLVLIFSQQLDDFIYTTTMYELVEKTLNEESQEKEVELERMIKMYMAEDENKETQILFEQGDQIPEEEDKVRFIFNLLKCAMTEGRQAYWEAHNQLIIKRIKEAVLLRDKLKVEQIFDEKLLFKTTLKSLKETETEEESVENQAFKSEIEDENGIVSQVRGAIKVTWPAITAQDRLENDFDEDQIYHEEPDEVVRHAEVDYLQRDSSLLLYLELKVHEYDDENDLSILTVVQNGVELQKIQLDLKNGLRIKDQIDPALEEILNDNLISLPGVIARMMQNLDRTMSFVTHQ